ncbi:hemerythrin domain-containing protein [Streptomyces cuspidosporus]|uniref:Hemerythrin domain-containing protein n=1 Tax=Streptomyces cuspidosporus TaxID=66882 RepID=A0ABP5SLA7_9ACTN
MTDRTQRGATSTDEDVVALLTHQHDIIREMLQQVERATGDARRDAFRRLVHMLAVHETAEEEVVHPTARRAFEGGEQVVRERLEEERQAKEKLSRLESMNHEDPEFMPLFITLRDAVLRHAEAEEQQEFTQLRAHTDAKRLTRMASAVKAAEAVAPTHPHPGTESAAKNLALGPIASIMDRTRDAVRNAMEKRG